MIQAVVKTIICNYDGLQKRVGGSQTISYIVIVFLFLDGITLLFRSLESVNQSTDKKFVKLTNVSFLSNSKLFSDFINDSLKNVSRARVALLAHLNCREKPLEFFNNFEAGPDLLTFIAIFFVSILRLLEFIDLLNKRRQTIVNLEENARVAGVSDIFDTDRTSILSHSFFNLRLLLLKRGCIWRRHSVDLHRARRLTKVRALVI